MDRGGGGREGCDPPPPQDFMPEGEGNDNGNEAIDNGQGSSINIVGDLKAWFYVRLWWACLTENISEY